MSVTRREAQRVYDERGVRYIWCVYDTDANAAAHLWIQTTRAFFTCNDASGCYGGIELHCGTRPSWGKKTPDHKCCGFLWGPCWHTGSSVAADRLVREFARWGTLDDLTAWNAAESYLREHLASEKEIAR